jgi:hypothetical protein
VGAVSEGRALETQPDVAAARIVPLVGFPDMAGASASARVADPFLIEAGVAGIPFAPFFTSALVV